MPARSSRNNNNANNNRNARNKKPSSASASTSSSTPSTDDEQLPAAPLNQQQQHRTSPLFSPPAHLPTPLPDELLSSTSLRLSSSPRMATEGSEAEYAAEHELPPLGLGLGLLGGGGDNVGGSSTLSHLIDFDTPTPPPARPSSLPSSSFDSEDSVLDHPSDHQDGEEGAEDDSLAHTYTAQMYRSPPFREAQLPPEEVEASPPPLPILPRSPHALAQSQLYSIDAYGEEDPDASGSMASSTMVVHTRAPTFAMRYVVFPSFLSLSLHFLHFALFFLSSSVVFLYLSAFTFTRNGLSSLIPVVVVPPYLFFSSFAPP
ncbi:hypothetical protein GALMADRAFT_1050535 [Galerina marginata CBS 339.88]|uniref:Uncharacterized protein n=1 Tax=Galerina marginata (strain CBS 339.88) TaxID=685588 RepID=A0A067SDI0_GALM3|nr:hypothetical protein GALMADRAFT_1050535 [Galerina marginata CBS 339.88]